MGNKPRYDYTSASPTQLRFLVESQRRVIQAKNRYIRDLEWDNRDLRVRLAARKWMDQNNERTTSER